MRNRVSSVYRLGGMILFIALAVVQSKAAETSVDRFSNSNLDTSLKAGQMGVGLEVGSLSGLSLQYWLDNYRTINGSVTAEENNTALNLDHIWLFRNAFAREGRNSQYFVPYIGAGGLLAFGDRSDYLSRHSERLAGAIHVPLGIEFLPQQRFDVFAELVPNIEVFPEVAGFWTAQLGTRFFF